MSLAFSFNLTPSQTTLLLRIRFEECLKHKNETCPPYLGDPSVRDFVTPAQALIRKGLVVHRFEKRNGENADGRPNYICTPEGVAMCDLIVRDAMAVIEISERGGEWSPPATMKGAPRAK